MQTQNDVKIKVKIYGIKFRSSIEEILNQTYTANKVLVPIFLLSMTDKIWSPFQTQSAQITQFLEIDQS